MEDVAHLLLLAELGLDLLLGGLKSGVLEAQLLDHCFPLPELVLHVADDLLGHGFAGPHVLSSHDNVPLELVRLLLKLRDPDVRLLQHGAEGVDELLAGDLGLGPVLGDLLQLSGDNVQLLLDGEGGGYFIPASLLLVVELSCSHPRSVALREGRG